MKTLSILLISTALVLFGCSKQDQAVVEPQQNQPKSAANARAGSKIDLKIDRIVYSGHATGDGAEGQLFLVAIMEKNIGTTTSRATATDYDEIKVYQRIRKSATTYYNRYIQSFRRTTDLAPSAVWTKPETPRNPADYIWIAKRYIPTDGSRAVELVFEADGGGTIDELSETNNLSAPLRVTW